MTAETEASTPATGLPTPPTTPAVVITIAPTGRAKCQKTREPIEKGSFRFTQGRVDGNHVISSHTLLKNVTKRVLQKHPVEHLLSGLDGEDRGVAKRIVEAVLAGASPSPTDLAHRSDLPSKPPKKKAKRNANAASADDPVLVD